MDDPEVSKGTVSSAQYRYGKFMFISMTDAKKGTFDMPALAEAIDATTSKGAAPKGFAYGNFEITTDAEGNSMRRITKASFFSDPNAAQERMLVKVRKKVFAYKFTHSDAMSTVSSTSPIVKS